MTEPATADPAWRLLLRRLGAGLLIAAALVAGVGAWAVLPRSLGTVGIEEARLLPAPPATDAGEADRRPAPARIAVTFTAAEDLESVRARLGLGYVAARLADCRNGAAYALQVVTQRAEYLLDAGRVRRLGEAPGGGVRYRAAFDDVLTELIDHRGVDTSAAATPGGLCFSLHGASMWFGWGRSNAVRVAVRP